MPILQKMEENQAMLSSINNDITIFKLLSLNKIKEQKQKIAELENENQNK